MTATNIICLVIYLGVASIMIGIGIAQLRSKSPVGFYSGEKPPREEDLTDVHAWNQKHGFMWLIYGGIIILSYIVGILIGDSLLCLIPLCGGIIVPVFIMIAYHNKLRKKYLR